MSMQNENSMTERTEKEREKEEKLVFWCDGIRGSD